MPLYNTVVGVHEIEPFDKWGALYIMFRQGRHHHPNATTETEANVYTWVIYKTNWQPT